MKVWVTRDTSILGAICIWGRKPFDDIDADGCWNDTVQPQEEYALARDFKRDYGFTPRKGSCDKYDVILIKVVK